MKNLKFFLLVIIVFSFQEMNAQRNNGDMYNRLGIQGGVSYGGIQTDNFKTRDKSGFIGGLTTRATVYNNFLVIYGINFFQLNTGMNLSQNPSGQLSEIDFKATGVQLNIFAGHKIFGEYLSFEAGPVLQVNSKWAPNKQYAEYYVEGYSLQAKDLKEITRVNINAAANLSAGFRNIKIWLQYQYGINNIYKKLNSDDIRNKDSRAANFNGHLNLAVAGIVFYL